MEINEIKKAYIELTAFANALVAEILWVLGIVFLSINFLRLNIAVIADACLTGRR